MATTVRIQHFPTTGRLPAGLVPHLELASRHRCGKGHLLFTQGQKERQGLWWLQSGRVKFSLLTDEGLERVVAFAGEGSIFGEGSVMTEGGYLVTCQAVTDVEAYFLDSRVISAAVKEDPSLAVELLGSLAEKLRLLVKLIEEMSFLGVKERVASALARLSLGETAQENGRLTDPGRAAGRQVRLSQQELASLVGASRVMVAHALAELKEEGVIDKGRRRLVIRDPKRLVDAARSRRLSGPH